MAVNGLSLADVAAVVYAGRRESGAVTAYVWQNLYSGRWYAYTPGKFGVSGATREEAIDEARRWTHTRPQFVDSTPPEVSAS
jgi:hypothetical protein